MRERKDRTTKGERISKEKGGRKKGERGLYGCSLLPSQRASPPGSSGVDGLLLDDLSREVAVVVRVLSVVEDDVVDEEEGDDGREDGDNRSSGEVKRSGRQSLHESRGAKMEPTRCRGSS
jgi:hypothetical protein